MENEIENILAENLDKQEKIAKIRKVLHDHSELKEQPIDLIHWVPLEKVEANDYNPNSVASTEMKLLYTSIKKDGYTQPIVTIYDPKKKKYVIIDGFHRYHTMKRNKDIYDRNNGKLPIVVLDKDINDRMASTVRHNRARGKHSVKGMSNLAFQMLNNGWSDAEICNELGMEPEELIRLKHLTGFSKLFENEEYKKAWKSRQQIRYEKLSKENPEQDERELNQTYKEVYRK